jgi:drug/metabolite transporter (DMT)-like permease
MPENSPRTATSQLWLAELSLLAVAVIWGVNIPVMKIALDMGIDRFALNGLRLVVSAATLLILAAMEFRSGNRPDLRGRWPRIVCYAVLVSGLYQLLFLLAVSQTTSADIALIMATVPLWTAIGARFLLREILSRLAWTGLLVAFAGTVLVTLSGAAESPAAAANTVAAQQRLAGNIIALLAALAWSGGTILSRPMLKAISPLQLAALSTAICLPLHLEFAWQTLPAGISLLSSIALLLCLLYSGTLSTGLAMPMWSYGVKFAGAAHATMFQNLSPIVAIVSAWLLLGESLSADQAIGGSLILGGLFIMRRARAETQAERPSQPPAGNHEALDALPKNQDHASATDN